MTLTGTWLKTPAGTLVLKWTADEAPHRSAADPSGQGRLTHRSRRQGKPMMTTQQPPAHLAVSRRGEPVRRACRKDDFS
jgi:hypothetical protein